MLVALLTCKSFVLHGFGGGQLSLDVVCWGFRTSSPLILGRWLSVSTLAWARNMGKNVRRTLMHGALWLRRVRSGESSMCFLSSSQTFQWVRSTAGAYSEKPLYRSLSSHLICSLKTWIEHVFRSLLGVVLTQDRGVMAWRDPKYFFTLQRRRSWKFIVSGVDWNIHTIHPEIFTN